MLVQCNSNKNNITGTYVSRNTVNTIDTLKIYSDSSYFHVIYRANDKSIVYENAGKWKQCEGYITFIDFYIDQDDVHSKEEGNFENVLMTTEYQLEKKSSKVIIHHIAMYDDMYLEKID